jgi:hypothetical protein
LCITRNNKFKVKKFINFFDRVKQALDNTFNVTFLTGLEKFVKTVKSKCETILKRFGSFRDVVSNNKILYGTGFWVNWAFLIALKALKPSLRSCFNLVPRAIRKAQFTQKLVA